MGELPGFETIHAPEPVTQANIVTPKPRTKTGTEKTAPIAKIKAEEVDRYLLNKEAQDILKVNEYYKLPSDYFKDVSTIDKVIDDLNEDLDDTSKAIKSTAYFV